MLHSQACANTMAEGLKAAEEVLEKKPAIMQAFCSWSA